MVGKLHQLMASQHLAMQQSIVGANQRLAYYAPYLAPTMASVKPDFLKQSQRLCRLLNKALEQIVNNYLSDQRIKDIYQLGVFFDSYLKQASLNPYQTGLFRPDMLQDAQGQARICEINARYPVDGWMVSYYLNRQAQSTIDSQSQSLVSNPKLTCLIEDLLKTFDPEPANSIIT